MNRIKCIYITLFVVMLFCLFYNITRCVSKEKISLHSNNFSIIYMADCGNIYKARFDTLEAEKFTRRKYNGYRIHDVNDEFVLMYGPNILMLDMEGKEVYKIQNDDIVDAVHSPIIYNNKIYYININDKNHIYSMNYCGEENEKVMAVSAERFLIKDDIVYFSMIDEARSCELYKQKIGGDEPELVINKRYTVWFKIYNDILYYSDYFDDNNIYALDLRSYEEKKIVDIPSLDFCFGDRNIFYLKRYAEEELLENLDRDSTIYKQKLH